MALNDALKADQTEGEVRKGKHNEPEAEDWVSQLQQQQPLHLAFDRLRWEAQCAKLRASISEEILQDVLKLHKAEREKWKIERDSWEVTRRSLKKEGCALEHQLRKLRLESLRRKAVFTRLASPEAEGKNVAEVCRDLHPIGLQLLDLQSTTRDREKVSTPLGFRENLKRSSDRLCGQLMQIEMDDRKGNLKKQEVEDWASQQQILQLILERQRREAQSEREKLEDEYRDVLDQLERRTVELQEASTSNSLFRDKISEQGEEIKRLKETELTECIICMDEFGEDPDRQRAYWKNCNHANVCYKCAKTLWSSKTRQCPSCRTAASSMPTRLPPKIYL